jgi:ABC-2 type transport system permease protein
MAAAGTSRVEDLRYTSYTGARRGRAACLWAFARQGALHALGAGRGWRGKLIPLGLVFFAFAPALIVLGVRALFASSLPQAFGRPEALTELVPYEAYYSTVSILILALAGIITPELLCPDRRDRVLDLYLATAVSPFEYVLGKFLAAVVPLLCLTFVPQFTLFVGNAIFDEDAFGYIRDNADIAPKIVVAGLLLAVYFALLGLAISSLTDRRPFAVGGFLGLVLVSAGVAGALSGLYEDTPLVAVALGINPIVLVQHVFGNVTDDAVDWTWRFASWLVVVLASILVLFLRYRRSAQ